VNSNSLELKYACSTAAAAAAAGSILCCSRFEAELAAYQGDDPLEPWLRYIHAMQDECPSDQSEQCSLLEVSKTARTTTCMFC
jgi:Mad3/BUB1 homology region 1